MAKKTNSQGRTPKRQAPVQFRPSEIVEEWLVQHAKTLKLSKNELAKWLIIAAMHELDARHLPLLAEVVSLLGRDSFEGACQHVMRAVTAANNKRLSTGHPLLTESERQRFIVDDLHQLVVHLLSGPTLRSGPQLDMGSNINVGPTIENLEFETTVRQHLHLPLGQTAKESSE